ncbi:MBL fold metallo-hydrolase [uncultured Muribaculum sp.]|uniref:MBL fold metallo-hydrolase n=1 Tax=uncultured Muribaculum sp. TaxID=1918613 RepID=UPI0025DD34D4|nr:MBL fold metallo-hydrolase [uncultured Muribaculum sp.]
MAKRMKYPTPDFPGLFDDREEMTYVPQPVRSDIIARHATRLEGGFPSYPRIAPSDSPFGPVVASPVPNRIRFMSLGSGSSGNCCYIGDSQCGFLVDAGVDAPSVTDTLRRHGISMQHIKGICITHDHSDHMRCVYTLLRKNRHMALYCTPRALSGIMRRHSVSRRLKDYHVAIYKEIPFTIGNFTITAFETMHDGTDNAGFYIQHDDRALTVATDLGCISPRVDHYMRMTDYLVIESNYDLGMLRAGSYPEYLKARIQTDNGHMDNNVTARYLAEIYTPRLKNVFLCHLSQENNTPEKAVAESRAALESIGLKVGAGNDTPDDLAADIQLVALPRIGESRFYSFRPPRRDGIDR